MADGDASSLLPVRVVRFDEIGSTSAHARAEVAAGSIATGPVAFVAVRQTAGVGRFGRAWASPAGGVWLTLAWPVEAARVTGVVRGLGLRVGVACLRTVRWAVEGRADAGRVRLKWPNDVLVDGRKVLGALTEVVRGAGGTWVLVGVGVNAAFDAGELPEELRGTATTLLSACGGCAPVGQIEGRLLSELVEVVPGVGLSGEVLAEAAAGLHGVGEEAWFTGADGGKRRGTFVGLDGDGMAVMEVGGERVVVMGGVVGV